MYAYIYVYRCVHMCRCRYNMSVVIITITIIDFHDCILAICCSGQNGRLEMTQFSVPTTSGTVSGIRKGEMYNTSGLTAPSGLNTCSMC